MLNIYLARHGQDKDNVNGILNGRRNMPLTELGQKQAKEVAEKIKDAGIVFDKIYTSPLKRTTETAKIIANTLGLQEPETMEDLIERDFGIMTGKPHTDIEKYCAPNILKTDTVTYFLSPEGAETFPQLKERGKVILEKIKQKHTDGNILLVTHGDIGKMIYAAFYNLDWKEFLPKFHFGNSDIVIMSESSPADTSHLFKTEQHNL